MFPADGRRLIGPIPWSHSGPLCHALSLLSLLCGHRCAGGVLQWQRATVATPGEWQCKAGGVRQLAVANGPNIFQMLLVLLYDSAGLIGEQYVTGM